MHIQRLAQRLLLRHRFRLCRHPKHPRLPRRASQMGNGRIIGIGQQIDTGHVDETKDANHLPRFHALARQFDAQRVPQLEVGQGVPDRIRHGQRPAVIRPQPAPRDNLRGYHRRTRRWGHKVHVQQWVIIRVAPSTSALRKPQLSTPTTPGSALMSRVTAVVRAGSVRVTLTSDR